MVKKETDLFNFENIFIMVTSSIYPAVQCGGYDRINLEYVFKDFQSIMFLILTLALHLGFFKAFFALLRLFWSTLKESAKVSEQKRERIREIRRRSLALKTDLRTMSKIGPLSEARMNVIKAQISSRINV